MKEYVKLFEEFTRQTGVPFIEKLRLFALASDVPTHVSEIEQDGVDASFKIDTKLPGDATSGYKSFKIVIPLNMATPYIITYCSDKEVKKDTIEAQKPYSTTPKIDIFLNYVEVTQIFNDPCVELLADNFDKFETTEQIIASIKKYG